MLRKLAPDRTVLPLGILCGLREPDDFAPQRLRRAQLEPGDTVAGLRLLLTVLAILFMWGLAQAHVPVTLLGLWGSATGLIAFFLFRDSVRRASSDYTDVSGAMVVAHAVRMLVQAALWTVPPLLFFRQASPAEVIALWTLTSCLMIGAAYSFAALPLSAAAFLLPVGFASAEMMRQQASFPAAMLIVCFATLLLAASMRHARSFNAHFTDASELAEKSEVVSLLLREFEESGADWLWQVNASRHLVQVSQRFAAALGAAPEWLEGKPLFEVLAGPSWQSGNFSPALRELADKMKRRESFSNFVLDLDIGGKTHWWELSASPRISDDGVFEGFRGVGSDITEQRESSQRIEQLARFDVLTDLPNRLNLTDSLSEALHDVEARGSRCAFLMIDLDRFKAVNDTLGHQVGDKLLAMVSQRLRNVCVGTDMCGRLGGDEFAVVCRDIDGSLQVERLARAIIEALSHPYEVDRHTLYIGASVGSAQAPRDGRDAETLIRNADLALYRAKDEGGGRHFEFEPRLHVHAEERRVLEIALREALEKNQLHVVYQPVVDSRSEDVVGFESLVRWTHPDMGTISPAQFIPVAEDARLIAPIGEWVLRTACMEAMHWPEHVRVAVNVSAEQLSDPSFVSCVVSSLAHSGLAANRLELEVTESVFLREGTGAVQLLEQLIGLGLSLSLDDFGTGYSSLGYLSKTRFGTIKIDRSFIVGAARAVPECVAIVRAVVAMADSLDMSTTAEGVETEEEARIIRHLGCTKIQGYHFGRPMAAEDARRLFDYRDNAVA